MVHKEVFFKLVTNEKQAELYSTYAKVSKLPTYEKNVEIYFEGKF